MQTLRIGLLGCGSMGSAIFEGLQHARHTLEAQDIQLELYAWNRSNTAALALEKIGISILQSPEELLKKAQYILVGTATDVLQPLLTQLHAALRPEHYVIAMAPGTNITFLKKCVQEKCAVVRLMPNMPARIGKGLFALCVDDPTLLDAQKELLHTLFTSLGLTLRITEEKFPAFTALAGSGPAYIFYFLEALAEAGVSMGLSRKESNELSLGLVTGSAALAQESGTPFSLLREEVCYPAGTTIAAINHLDRTATRAHIIDAIFAAQAKAIALNEE